MQEISLSSILNSVHVKYTIVPSIFLSFIAYSSVNSGAWIVSDVHHFYFEMFAVILSTIIAFYGIARANSLNEKFSLFMGIGFLTIAVIDFLHATLSYSAAGNNVFLAYFIPQTWFAGRTFLGVMLVVGVVKYTKTSPVSGSNIQTTVHTAENFGDKREEVVRILASSSSLSSQKQPRTIGNKGGNNNALHRSLLFSLIMLAILAICVVGISFFTVFPGIVTDFPIGRPYEIPALILFSVALFYFYKRRLYESEDIFYRGLLGALIVDIFAQIIMSYSYVNFHTAHNVAHILKDSGYFVIVISLAMSSIQHSKVAKERAEIIRMQYLKLKEANKMKDEFINVAAHELRTPIQPVLGLSELIRSRLANSSDNNNNNNTTQREMLDVIIRNAKRLQRLTENILDVTKIESQSLVMKIERFDICEIILNAIDDVTASSDYLKKQEHIKILYDHERIFVDADKIRLMQVISNLLSNSIKFTSEGSVSVTVEEKKASGNSNTCATTTASTDDEVVICVRDTGQGIDPKVLPDLFSKFTSHNPSGGTGLGLFISKSIVEAHGGKIWASNNEDENGRKKGATFTFTLPISNNRRQRQQQLLPSSLSTMVAATATTATVPPQPSYLNAATTPLTNRSDVKKSKGRNE